MISLLSRLFIKNCTQRDPAALRRAYGVLCGALGIFLNLILFAAKLVAASLTGSVSVAADAFNNLSDAGSSVVTLVGFKLAGQKPDPGHPFGHGRIEYVSGFLVSLLILLMGFELGKSSVQKLLDGSGVAFSTLSVVILALSIGVKLYMYFYNTRLGKRFDSATMRATGADCLGDCVSTAAVLLCTLLAPVVPFPLDGWCGLAVAIFILVAGLRTAKETIDPLLGTPPEREFVKRIEAIVLSYPEVSGIHDLIVHNYGPGRVMISLHAEVPQTADILVIHDCIDNMEKRLAEELHCSAVVHMDPIATNDELTLSTREKVAELALAIDHRISIHDFRMVVGETHTNLIFDMAVPFDVGRSEEALKADMERLVKVIDPRYFTVIHIDTIYTS
ncbi:MAG: cation transporter [Clostridia bacterium]|nr:cation transporter [Clostridia bacterium]